MNILRGLIGIAVMILICYLLSNDRKNIQWRSVMWGIGLQFILFVSVAYVPFVKYIFEAVANFFVLIMQFTEAGASFVLGKWPDVAVITDGVTNESFGVGYMFAFKVLPTIIFFSALSSVMYYLGILQFIIKGFAWVMTRTMGLSGTESLAAAANVFIGQTEAPLVIKPYLKNMTDSEMMCLMVGGMATIAGGVFAAFITFLGGTDVEMQRIFATHLLTASIVSAPAAIVAGKLLVPEKIENANREKSLNISKAEIGNNILEAISKGTTDGIKLAVNVGAMLLVFTALVAMVNYILSNGVGGHQYFFGEFKSLNEYIVHLTDGKFTGFNLEFILGILFAPIAWIIGIENQDLLAAGQLLGIKTTLNEFIAYSQLQTVKENISHRSVIILTYALCGFANFASIGIQIGGIGALAPEKIKVLTQLGVKALVGGTIACLMTGALAGMFN